MAVYKTPGVYIVEENAFPDSVVEVATSIPAFVGYTETAKHGSKDLTGVPTRVSNMSEFQTLFGGAPKRVFKRGEGADGEPQFEAAQQFYLFAALKMFFDNGGGTCWIVSVGGYETETPGEAEFGDAIWEVLAKEDEPSIYLCPDAVALDRASYAKISNRMMAECQALANRVAILDVYDGTAPIETAIDDPDTGFRNTLNFGENPSFGTAYYPWLDSTVHDAVDFTDLDEDSRATLAEEVLTKAKSAGNDATSWPVARLKEAPRRDHPAKQTHQVLMDQSPHYNEVMKQLLKAVNVMPPSGAVAGVYARTDSGGGVFRAPANTGIVGATAPTVTISHDEQEGLNIPLDGRAVNAIRSFVGRGLLIWGARTLDGNSQDFRYVNVRRTLIMLEQSIKLAAQAYVFEANDAGTWQAVRSMIENFLNNQWKAGALAGSKPQDAFSVDVGLGSTMTGQDILDGYMRTTVRVAIVHPAEFIVLTFQQEMQTS